MANVKEWSALTLEGSAPVRSEQGASSDDDSEDWDVSHSRGGPNPWRTRGVVRAALLGAGAAVVLLGILASRGPAMHGGAPTEALGLSDAGAADAAVAAQAADDALNSANTAAVAPKAHLNDGNLCGDDEEEHLNLCYDTCSALTGGEYTFRQSAWTCCKKAVCPFLSTGCCKHNFGFCSGFDISGKQESNGKKICPHKPGACLKDEELFLDVCYMKCSILTADEYPYRVASATCCKKSDASCMVEDGLADGLNGQSITNSTFDVGGGCNDQTNSTHCKPHEPQQSLTEAQ